MKEQDFSNHSRVYPLHFFIVYPLCLLAVGYSIFGFFNYDDQKPLWTIAILLSLLITLMALMLRQHYGLKNQDRIIRLELRLRYFQLTGKRFDEKENQLSFSQMAALRFASDEELLILIDRAIAEHLPAKTIKQSITHWMPDHMRV
jgi:hypothetical protein